MRRTSLLILWLLSDLIVFIGSYALAYFMRVGWIFSSDFPFGDYVKVVLLVAPIWLGVLIVTRTFSLMRKQFTGRTFAYMLFACVMATSLFALTYFFLYGLFFSRLLLLQAMLMSMAATYAWHLIFGLISRNIMRTSPPVYPTLIIGATREAANLIDAMNRNKSPLVPVAVLDGRGTKETTVHGVPVEGKLNKLEETITKHRITHLIQCSDLEQSLNLLSACRNAGISYLLLPSVLGIVERDERIESLEGQPVTVVRPKDAWWGWFFR